MRLGSFLGRYEPVKIACLEDLKSCVRQAIIIAENREKNILIINAHLRGCRGCRGEVKKSIKNKDFFL